MAFLIDMLPSELECAVRENRALLIPVGSIEFHGNHLPIGTDLFIVEKVAKEVGKRADVVVAPSIVFTPTGYMVSGPDKGTIDISVGCFISFCREVLANYKKMGFKRIILIVHHQGGSISAFLKTAILEWPYSEYKEYGGGWWTRRAGRKDNCKIEVAGAVLDTHFFGGHGGKGETEAIMSAKPYLVRMDLVKENDFWWNAGALEASEENAQRQMDMLIDRWIEKINDMYK